MRALTGLPHVLRRALDAAERVGRGDRKPPGQSIPLIGPRSLVGSKSYDFEFFSSLARKTGLPGRCGVHYG